MTTTTTKLKPKLMILMLIMMMIMKISYRFGGVVLLFDYGVGGFERKSFLFFKEKS